MTNLRVDLVELGGRTQTSELFQGRSLRAGGPRLEPAFDSPERRESVADTSSLARSKDYPDIIPVSQRLRCLRFVLEFDVPKSSVAPIPNDARAIQATPLAYLHATHLGHPLIAFPTLAVEDRWPAKTAQIGELGTTCSSGATGVLERLDGLK